MDFCVLLLAFACLHACLSFALSVPCYSGYGKRLLRISVLRGRQATLGGGSLREEGVAAESDTAVSR